MSSTCHKLRRWISWISWRGPSGAIIVGSILLAFAIDAWWDGSRDRAEEREMLADLRVELRENRSDILEIMDLHRDAGRRIEALFGMDEAAIRALPEDSVYVSLSDIFRFNTFDDRIGALNAATASGL